MRILITNDDGIHGEGLKALTEIAHAISDDAISDEVWVVAPDEERSGVGHAVSLATPLRYRKLEDRKFEVSGTPADCIVMATRKIMPGLPDLILSGVNRGQNIADDVTYSGTIGAAMEGTGMGIKSIALSQATGMFGNGETFAVARKHGVQVVQKLIRHDFGQGVLMNVNFPDCAVDAVRGVAITSIGTRATNHLIPDERKDNRGGTYYWLSFARDKGTPSADTDIWAIHNQHISITPIHMNLTKHEALAGLRSVF